MRILWISLTILLIFTIGCVPPAHEALSPALNDSPSQGDTIEMNPTTPADAGLQNLIERAKEDLAGRLKIVLNEISLIEAKAVVWPDASLGCPQPGMRYKQVPEDGALIVLQVNGINYEYHNGGSRGLFLCQKSTKDPNPPPKIDLQNLTPSRVDPSNPGTPTPDNSIPPGENQ